MLTEKQLERYADVLLWGLGTARSQKFSKGDVVLIRYDRPALPLAEILFTKILQKGMNPAQRLMATFTMEKNFYEISDSGQLIFQTPGDKELYEHLNGSIYLYAPESITHLSTVDPTRIGKVAVARKHLREILDQREEQGFFGWTLGMYPTPELARHAKLSMEAYAGQVIQACFLNEDDPVAAWRQIYAEAGAIKDWLNRLEVVHFHVEGRNIDLFITPGESRKWIGISGHNIPSFELFMSPDWRGTHGFYVADQPSFRSGNYVHNVRLEFKEGQVVHSKAETGGEFVKTQVSMDEGAGRLGEFSLTDRRFSRINSFMANTLYDENFGGPFGNCHIALGSSYSDTFAGDPATLTKAKKEALGFNDSALHWDLVNTEEKRVTARLKSGAEIVIYENGIFQN